MNRTAHILSVIFSPLLTPTYGVALAMLCSNVTYAVDAAFVFRVVAMVFLITAVVPSAAILALKGMGLLSDVALNNRNERALPYCIVCLSYLCTAFYFYAGHFPQWFILFMAGAAVAVVVSIVVNIWWKISAHMAAMGGVVALLMRIIADNHQTGSTFAVCIVAIVLTGVVASARVALRRHTLGQVLAGTLNGWLWVWLATMI